MSKIISNIT